MGEIFLTVEEGLKMEGVKAKVTLKDIWEGLRDLLRFRRLLIMGSLIGCWLGIQSGGATPASFMAYGFAKSSAADKDQFGKGASSGIIAPEAAGVMRLRSGLLFRLQGQYSWVTHHVRNHTDLLKLLLFGARTSHAK